MSKSVFMVSYLCAVRFLCNTAVYLLMQAFPDGEWESVIVDDQLYLNRNRYDDAANPQEYTIRGIWKNEEDYDKNFFKGSEALYFASSVDKNETWVPLLEKAYAKFHCDYSALYGGFTGLVCHLVLGSVYVLM
jgi:hypothetical protein